MSDAHLCSSPTLDAQLMTADRFASPSMPAKARPLQARLLLTSVQLLSLHMRSQWYVGLLPAGLVFRRRRTWQRRCDS